MPVSVDGYLVRSGRAEDVTAFAELNGAVQLQEVTGGEPHAGVAAWVRDLFDGHHTVRPADFLIAEDVRTGQVAAGLVGIAQSWVCAGARLPVIQVELVATDPEHR